MKHLRKSCISFRVSEDVKMQLDVIAEINGWSVSYLCYRLVLDALAEVDSE